MFIVTIITILYVSLYVGGSKEKAGIHVGKHTLDLSYSNLYTSHAIPSTDKTKPLSFVGLNLLTLDLVLVGLSS